MTGKKKKSFKPTYLHINVTLMVKANSYITIAFEAFTQNNKANSEK